MLRLVAAVLAGAPVLACLSAEADGTEASARGEWVDAAPPTLQERIDVHVHLVDGRVHELLAALDRHRIARAVVLASPHLDPAQFHHPDADLFGDWREANERLLRWTAPFRERLVPFVTLDPAEAEPGELESWLSRGACGVKLYVGHRDLHERSLADPRHDALFTALERRRVPLLLHVNTFRFEDELAALLAAHPALELVCPHFCGSRTDVARLERLLRTHPRLRVDTSHGPGAPGIDGFANLEREKERVRSLIQAEPQRFLFGSDLVTDLSLGDPSAIQQEWDRQIAANLNLLAAERFTFWRREGDLGEYAGLGLDDEALARVLADNARRWLAACP